MDIIIRFEKIISNYKEKKKLICLPIYKNTHSNEIVYIIKMEDHEKRNKQISRYSRAEAWIYVYDIHIAKAFKLKSKDYKHLLKSSGAKYSKDNGCYFKSKEMCLSAINELYKHVIYNCDIVL